MAGRQLLGLVGLLALQPCRAQLVVDLLVDKAGGGARLAAATAADAFAAEEAFLLAEPRAGLRHPTICDASVRQYSGYFTVRGTGVSPQPRYFFWLIESRRDPITDPLVMWLNGGPGCSSIAGLLTENGPCTVNASGTGTLNNPFSWTTRANVVWVDQPSGTGFSVGPAYAHLESQVATAMYGFLQRLLTSSELKKFASNDFFIIGESYAGHYVPAIGHRIWRANQRQEGIPINMKGIGIGNGLTVPHVQYKYYEKMAADGGLELGGSLQHGAITDLTTLREMQAKLPECLELLRACEKPGADKETCINAFYECRSQVVPYAETGLSPYDMRRKCTEPPLCMATHPLYTYLNLPEVQAQLGAHRHWEVCNYDVNSRFYPEFMQRFDDKLPDMLSDGIQVLIYAGDVDFVCNWLGNKAWTLGLKWPHQAEFNAASDEPFLHDGKMVGRVRTAAKLSFMQIFDAGHMVPMDQPAAALAMLDSFLTDRLEDTARDGSGTEAAEALLAVPGQRPTAFATTAAPGHLAALAAPAASFGLATAVAAGLVFGLVAGAVVVGLARGFGRRLPRHAVGDYYVNIAA